MFTAPITIQPWPLPSRNGGIVPPWLQNPVPTPLPGPVPSWMQRDLGYHATNVTERTSYGAYLVLR